MNGIAKELAAKELAAKAADDYKVSAQNREAWAAGYLAGFIKGRVYAYTIVAESCEELASYLEAEIKSANAEE